MIKILISKLKLHNVIVKNFSYLSILQFFNLFFPVIIYPYFIKLFGLDLWGTIVYAQAVVLYATVFVNFGFDMYGAKEVSINRENPSKLAEITSCIVVLRVILGVIVFILFYFIISFFSFFDGKELLYLLSYGVCFNYILFPRWFFQGIENMKYIVIVNLSIKITFVLLMFLLIKDSSDYLLVPLFFGLGAFFGGAIGLYLMFSKEGVKFKFYKLSKYFFYIKKSLPLFGSNLIISIKDKFNIFIIGYLLGMQEVAIYDLGIKMMGLIMQPINIINDAIYPKVARDKNMNFVKKVAFFSFIVIVLGVIIIQSSLTFIIDFLSMPYNESNLPLRVLILCPLFLSISVFMAKNCLIVFDKFYLLFKGMLVTTVFYLLLIGIAFYYDTISLIVFAIITMSVYLFELLYRGFICYKYKLL